MYTERDGQAGYGVVVQDINATNSICMGRIRDLKNYHKMVPHVKSVEVYEQEHLANVSPCLLLRSAHDGNLHSVPLLTQFDRAQHD
jgi:hypothetical protein